MSLEGSGWTVFVELVLVGFWFFKSEKKKESLSELLEGKGEGQVRTQKVFALGPKEGKKKAPMWQPKVRGGEGVSTATSAERISFVFREKRRGMVLWHKQSIAPRMACEKKTQVAKGEKGSAPSECRESSVKRNRQEGGGGGWSEVCSIFVAGRGGGIRSGGGGIRESQTIDIRGSS